MWVLRYPSDLHVGDRVRAVTDPPDEDCEFIGEIDKIDSRGFYVRVRTSTPEKVVYLANVLRTYYRWEKPVLSDISLAPDPDVVIEVIVDGHTFQLGDGQHLRVWLEEGRIHVEVVLP